MLNRLQHETSPYLRQHAGNPVDWYPWGAEALERARAEDKPILLSIGYSACHWCHVMAHESFEHADVAAVMNRGFVNIKVDREERPDVDQIYQTAHQLLTRRAGGWPLTMFLTPDQVPFFGGTYFPREPRYGMPGFVDVMERVLLAWQTRRKEIEEQNGQVASAIAQADDAVAGPVAGDAALAERALARLRARFDAEHGGFGAAPKFPHPTHLELCLRAYARSGDRESLHVALHTLRRMAEGGIYDQLGGGFCRYSVDRSWTIPHFEKMLYDNAQLLPLYADAWTITREPLFERVTAETAAWVMRDMQSPEGGYYSSLDADSEGEEGKFYLWSAQEPRALLSDAEYAITAARYGLDGAPNFVDPHAAAHASAAERRWHLTVRRSLSEAAAIAGVAPEAAATLLDQARAKLLAARGVRVPPGRDDKILTSWNALMIGGMARAAFVFGRGDWAASARAACRFIAERMLSGGRLLATFKDGRAHLGAYLDDYAFLIKAILQLLEIDFEPSQLALAQRLAATLRGQFEDAARGGFFFTAHDHERLLKRPKSGYDNATPSGNGVAAQALARLGHLTGDGECLDSARRTLAAFGGSMAEQPEAYGALLIALEELSEPPTSILLRGDASQFPAWRRAVALHYRPAAAFLATDAPADALPEALAKPAPATGVLAYVCRGAACRAPVDHIDQLLSVLDDGAADSAGSSLR